MEAEKISAICARFFREAILWSLSQIVNFISHIFLPFSIWVPFSHNIFHYWKVSFESVRGWPSAMKVLVKRCNKPYNFRYEEDAGEVLFYVEIVIMTQFSIEYVLRIWSAGCRGRYEGIRGRLRYALEFFPLLDLVVVTAGIILFIFGWSDSRGLSASSALRSLR